MEYPDSHLRYTVSKELQKEYVTEFNADVEKGVENPELKNALLALADEKKAMLNSALGGQHHYGLRVLWRIEEESQDLISLIQKLGGESDLGSQVAIVEEILASLKKI